MRMRPRRRRLRRQRRRRHRRRGCRAAAAPQTLPARCPGRSCGASPVFCMDTWVCLRPFVSRREQRKARESRGRCGICNQLTARPIKPGVCSSKLAPQAPQTLDQNHQAERVVDRESVPVDGHDDTGPIMAGRQDGGPICRPAAQEDRRVLHLSSCEELAAGFNKLHKDTVIRLLCVVARVIVCVRKRESANKKKRMDHRRWRRRPPQVPPLPHNDDGCSQCLMLAALDPKHHDIGP